MADGLALHIVGSAGIDVDIGFAVFIIYEKTVDAVGQIDVADDIFASIVHGQHSLRVSCHQSRAGLR